jgi:hypothetical protein
MTANPVLATEITPTGPAKTRTYNLSGVAPEAGWHTATVTALHEAEDLLDALEANGFQKRELSVLGDSLFVVRWQ